MHTDTMAPKGDTFKNNTKKNTAPKFYYNLVNEGIKVSSSSGDLVEYPIKGQWVKR